MDGAFITTPLKMEIIKEPNKILHGKATRINLVTPAIKALILDMKKNMIASNGVGLAANQVGSDLCIFVIDKKLAGENNVPDVYINPEILEYSQESLALEEGCLSLPNFWPQIKRAKKVRLKALDENGNKIKIKARGFLARVFQHEIDHLNGLLINNRT